MEAWTVEELAAGRAVNRVTVDEERLPRYAEIALDRMLTVV